MKRFLQYCWLLLLIIVVFLLYPIFPYTGYWEDS